MGLNASNFVKKRTSPLRLTQNRIDKIITCIITSYEDIINAKVIYDYSKIGSIKKEDYLRNRLVDDYLENELNKIEQGTNNFTINKETSEEYTSLVDGQLHDDPIDIHVVDYALKSAWKKASKPYLAIECKRLTTSVSSYVNDTKKATERTYSRVRIPFEGQLGFIENKKWDYKTVSEKVKELTSNSNIETTQKVKKHTIKKGFDGTYISKHKKINNTQFSVYHLFLDYSEIVIN
ncbi:hypothetical protein V3A08_15285 [Tenacibaculum maritimum]|uniref:hypothetical protein n=1 Tax=Tenacibaculum maritimum TaxID=107401 RepID=UPI0012E4722C|nr:hypothetical protein [Tenacibaculum maritimum]CAA0173376.1 conserved hypothetical protein [Tenacibaculum maritimum]